MAKLQSCPNCFFCVIDRRGPEGNPFLCCNEESPRFGREVVETATCERFRSRTDPSIQEYSEIRELPVLISISGRGATS